VGDKYSTLHRKFDKSSLDYTALYLIRLRENPNLTSLSEVPCVKFHLTVWWRHVPVVPNNTNCKEIHCTRQWFLYQELSCGYPMCTRRKTISYKDCTSQLLCSVCSTKPLMAWYERNILQRISHSPSCALQFSY